MELLDEKFPIDFELSKELIKEKLKLKQDYSKLKKKINNARIALAIIFAFSLFSIIFILQEISDPLVTSISVGLMIVFGVCAATPLKYAKISLSIAFGIYIINLLASFFQDPMYAILGLLVKSFFIYFIYIGMVAAFKYSDIMKKMERLNITPYKD